MLMTMPFDSFMPASVIYGPEGRTAILPQDIFAAGKTTGLDEKEKLQQLIMADINRSTQALISIIDRAEQDATISRVVYGTLQVTLSGVALDTLKAGHEGIFYPRLVTHGLLYCQSAAMIRNQLLAIGGTVELDGEEYDTL